MTDELKLWVPKEKLDAAIKRAEAAEELLKQLTYSYAGIGVVGDAYAWYQKRNAHLKEYANV